MLLQVRATPPQRPLHNQSRTSDKYDVLVHAGWVQLKTGRLAPRDLRKLVKALTTTYAAGNLKKLAWSKSQICHRNTNKKDDFLVFQATQLELNSNFHELVVRMFGGSVVGLSSLRQHQAKAAEPSEKAKELQAYLSKYQGDKSGSASKVKKKKKRSARPQPAGVRIFEEDNTGFQRNAVQEEDGAEDEGDLCFEFIVSQLLHCHLLQSQ